MEPKKNSDKQLTYINLNSSTNKIDILDTSENKKYFNNNKKSFNEKNIYLFFLSEYGFFILFFLIIIIFKYIPEYHPPKIFSSKNSKGFNFDEEPKVFLHLTDIHLSKTRPSKSDGSLIFLTTILNYEPNFIILTGDIVDNFRGYYYWHRVGIQNDDDWNIYEKSFRKMISKYPVIDVAGNHDVWAVDTIASKENKFLDNSHMFNRTSVSNENDFIIRKIKIFNLTFILFNDYRFPNPRPPYGNEPYTTKDQLDLLENSIDEIGQEDCFILTHYNVDRMWYITSSKGHTFEEIISKSNVYAIFTGHRHPKKVEIIHHGDKGGLEFCTSSTFDKKRAGLITIDNDNVIYHDVFIPIPGEEPNFFLSYPVPDEQISSHHVFNLNEFEIRVISYIKDKNIKLKIKGDINGELKYKKTLKNGAYLFANPVTLKEGHYQIHIYDENGYSCNIKTGFTIGNKFKGKKEKVLNHLNFYAVLRFSFIIFFIYIFIIIFPYRSRKEFKLVNNIENIINGKENFAKYNILILLLLIIILSPFIIRKRYQKANDIIRKTVIFVSIYPFILPVHFFENINGKFGFVFNAFTVIGTSIRYEHWCIQMIYMFYVSTIFPYVIYISAYSYHKRSKKIKYINNTIILLMSIIFSYNHIYCMAQSISIIYLLLTSGNIICWIILIIITCKYYYPKKKKLVQKKIAILI